MAIQADYIERLYAGWLGKIIGVRLGAPIEGMTYAQIKEKYGENVYDYIMDYNDFAADDDTNGPMFFLRALTDYTCSEDLTSEQIGKTWLNYTPYEHGFYWWGGYGVSTEHTAYLNLRAGIPAPVSGSFAQNGKTVAEQIGGQIFIDSWGLINPGNPQRASRFAKKAASVSHDGEGVYGGMFIAAAIALAFTEKSIKDVIEKALEVIPENCEYYKVTRDIIAFYDKHPNSWRKCFDYIFDNYGYDKYPGNCHIIPNSAVMILSLLYGKEDFTETICICNMCGWDTDCTTGNVGAIIGTFVGLDKIDEKWRAPVHDFLACSSVVGCLNIMDVPWAVSYMAKIAYDLNNEPYPPHMEAFVNGTAPKYNFILPGSTHSFRIENEFACQMKNTNGTLNIKGKVGNSGLKLYQKTCMGPKDFTDNRYTPSFSPILYPGQTVKASIKPVSAVSHDLTARLYVINGSTGETYFGETTALNSNKPTELCYNIPHMTSFLDRAGILIKHEGAQDNGIELELLYMDFLGKPNFTVDYSKESAEIWAYNQKEVHGMSYLKGLWYLNDNAYHGSGADFAEAYTGDIEWDDVKVTGTLSPIQGKAHQIMFRVQGAARSYGIRLAENNKLCLVKNADCEYITLREAEFKWELGKEYTLTAIARGNSIKVLYNDKALLEYTDTNNPYLKGAVGFGVYKSHCAFKAISVKGL